MYKKRGEDDGFFFKRDWYRTFKEMAVESKWRWLGCQEVNDNIVIETKYGLGFINFYPDCIIELDVENKMTKEKVFFIHFQMNNFHHALGLLYDMRLCLQRLTTSKKNKSTSFVYKWTYYRFLCGKIKWGCTASK